MAYPDGQRRIRRLPLQLANQIAAGEVVERPASVVKELVENGLDAGATYLRVRVEQGGRRLIRVQDDGRGIHADDLALALDRHATSKVLDLEELTRVTTLGFRGEALPSIASVSRLILSSRQADADSGWSLHSAEDGSPTPPVPVAHPPGTTVVAQDLFFNTPGRRKFMRTERTEFGHIQHLVERLSLSRFDVGFDLHHNGRPVYQLRPAVSESARERRIAGVCGRAFLRQALRIDFEASGLRLWGWLGEPGLSRGATDVQYLFVNGRAVRDSLVAHATRQAYGDWLPEGRHPAYVLYLELDPSAVDANVHPAKHEVRFRDHRLVHDFVLHSLGSALTQGAESAPGLAHREASADAGSVQAPATGGWAEPAWATVANRRARAPAVRETLAAYGALYGAATTSPAGETMPRPAAGPDRLGTAIGTVHGRYLVAENAAGLVLVDMHAAQACLARSQMRAALASGRIPARPLLVPASVAVDTPGAVAAECHAGALARMGLELNRAGPQSVLVRSLPATLAGAEVAPLLHEILASLPAGQTEVGPADCERLVAVLSRHVPTRIEGTDDPDRLLRRLEQTLTDAGPGSCRDCWTQLSLDALGRLCAAST